MNIKLIQKMLKFSGYDVCVAITGTEGLAMAIKENPDLILMDINLPDFDGLEVTRRIKAHSNTRQIPVIALTARNMVKDRQEALAAGCSEYLAKPTSRAELLKVINHYLSYIPAV